MFITVQSKVCCAFSNASSPMECREKYSMTNTTATVMKATDNDTHRPNWTGSIWKIFFTRFFKGFGF
jgi:hypothetical protein